jgi:uncharacterized membrane protein YfcA
MRLARLAVIATVAGSFSALFGVGGGALMVPLLVLWFGYGEREATGTSLAAIPLIALLGAALHGVAGNVEVAEAALVGAPAIGGVVVGAALQQRVPTRAVAALLAILLLSSAIILIF